FVPQHTPEQDEALIKIAGSIATAGPLIVTGYGAWKTARDYRVAHIDVPIAGLPSNLSGFTIAHISDIHSGIYMHEQEMSNILEIINGLHPQMAALTGDFIDSSSSEIEPVARVFSQVRSDYGTFACMGNHDLFDNYSKVSAAMKNSGIMMLDNANRVI